MERVDLCVVGLGYIGLPLAVVAANSGLRVHGFDVNVNAVNMVANGTTHFNEPGLEAEVALALRSGNFTAGGVPVCAKVFVIAVPTPYDSVAGVPDTTYVRAAVTSVADKLSNECLIVIESTCPVGTTVEMAAIINELRPDLVVAGHGEGVPDVSVAYCPERILPGNAIEELKRNERIVGGITPVCGERAHEFYSRFVSSVISTASTPMVAETVKLVENSFRDVNIAFANELSMLCDETDCDVLEVIDLANRHPRVSVLKPGAGVGGHCIAVDPLFLIHSGSERSTRLMSTARNVNNSKPIWVVEKVLSKLTDLTATLPENASVQIACYGLAYKADVDDLRESPSFEIIRQLSIHLGKKIFVNEPNINRLPAELEGHAVLASLNEALTKGGVHVVLVGHRQYFGIDWESVEAINVAGI